MPMTPGYYMPQTPYLNTQSYAQMPQAYPQMPTAPNAQGMIWVDGEIGAKAFQMPAGWPVGTPIALWDINNPIIYLKSINQMGVPSQLYKIHYTMEEQYGQKMLPQSTQQMSGDAQQETNNYATKDDIEKFKNDIREMLKQNQQSAAQTGSQNNQNRGGNR